jgi:hypothetical protein
MVANLPESIILPTADGCFWQWRPVLNPTKGVFALQDMSSAQGTICCLISCRSFPSHRFFSPLHGRVRSAPLYESFHIEKHVSAIAEVLGNHHIVPFRTKLRVVIRRQAIFLATEGPPIPAATFSPSLGPPSSRLYSSCCLQPANSGGSGP